MTTLIPTEVTKTTSQVDKTAKSLAKVVQDILKAGEQLKSISDIAEALAFDIEAKSSELANLKVKFAETERQQKADLNLRVSEDAEATLSKLMKDRGLATITHTSLQSLTSELTEAQADNTASISKAVAIATNSAKTELEATKKSLSDDHKVETAKFEADNASLNTQITFLKDSVKKLEDSLDNEREARVEMSKNSSQPTINVGTSK